MSTIDAEHHRLPIAMSVSCDDIDSLVKRIETLTLRKCPNRVLVSVAGVPGAGKTTLVKKLAAELSAKHRIKTQILPQDGFHYYRSELLKFDDPQTAIDRRGAPFTFNAAKYVETVKQTIQKPYKDVYAPSFDHSIKDPKENDICISSDVAVVLLEGNYVNLKDEPWCELNKIVDEKWFITTDLELVRKRLIARHLEAGIASTPEEAMARADLNDLKNGDYILKHSFPSDLEIVTE